MKIGSIHIQHFGHFVNFDLKFGEQPFVLLYGRNEAGKTTLLEFLRQLLFGFPERTPYVFGEGGELSGSAGLKLADGRAVELKRRKGRKNTVQARLDGQAAELDDTRFRQLLGNANENVFKTVFAFGLDELRAGNEGLRDESLQSALFGGGLGVAFNPETLLAELNAAADQLFRPSASKPSINALVAELKSAATQIKQKMIRSDEYERREAAWRVGQATADQFAAELQQLRLRQAQVDRLATALPLWSRLQELRAQRQTIQVPPGLTAEAESQFEATNAAIQRLTREVGGLQREIADATQQLEALQLDKTVLPLRNEIEDCQRLIQSVADARRDLPLRRCDRENLRDELTTEIERLRRGWTLEDLQSFAIDLATRREFDQLCQRQASVLEQRTRLQTRQTEIEAALERVATERESLGESRDVTLLVDIVDQSADYVADVKALGKQADDHVKELRTLEFQRARLSPPLSAEAAQCVEAVHRLPIPPRELVLQYDREFRELQQQCASARQSLLESQQQLEQLRQQLDQICQQHRNVPSLADLHEQRTTRDALWRQLRIQFIDPPPRRAAPPVSEPARDATPQAYEQAVQQADGMADEIYRCANEVTLREELQRRIVALETVVRQRTEESQRVAQEVAAVGQRWKELWHPCGFEPLSSDLMIAWVDAFTAFAAAHDEAVQREVDLGSYRNRIAAFEAQLRQVLGAPDENPKKLLAAAKRQAESAKDEEKQRQRLDREEQRSRKQLQEIRQQWQSWTAEEAAWNCDWKQLLTRLGFPEDWDVPLARDVLGQLSAAREKLVNLSDLERRIAQMEQRVAEFDPRVSRICQQLGEETDSDRPEIRAQSLQQRLAEATQMQERRANLEKHLASQQKTLRDRQAELAGCHAQRERLLQRASVTTDDQFHAIAATARRAAQWDAEIQELVGQLAVARGNEPEGTFLDQLQAADGIQLKNESATLCEAMERKVLEEKRARELAGSLHRHFQDLDGRDEAALLQEQLARRQAQLATDVHRYVPLVFAKTLLQAAIKRFERENQPELIGDISRLFATMTGNRYVEIERPSSDRSALYVRRSDGVERTPEQLSTGTREQLYLAIRLGYVLHYCRQAEPLPIVMDDVLVNFDAHRALATLEALRDVSQHVQILFLTCHHHVGELVARVFPDVHPMRLSGTSS